MEILQRPPGAAGLPSWTQHDIVPATPLIKHDRKDGTTAHSNSNGHFNLLCSKQLFAGRAPETQEKRNFDAVAGAGRLRPPARSANDH